LMCATLDWATALIGAKAMKVAVNNLSIDFIIC